jgi:hypothetical protein
LLPTLKQLYLFRCELDDLPTEVCGQWKYENVLDKVRAHYEDLKGVLRHIYNCRECKVITLIVEYFLATFYVAIC